MNAQEFSCNGENYNRLKWHKTNTKIKPPIFRDGDIKKNTLQLCCIWRQKGLRKTGLICWHYINSLSNCSKIQGQNDKNKYTFPRKVVKKNRSARMPTLGMSSYDWQNSTVCNQALISNIQRQTSREARVCTPKPFLNQWECWWCKAQHPYDLFWWKK